MNVSRIVTTCVIVCLLSCAANAFVVLSIIGAANPQGVPTNGGTQYLVGLTLDPSVTDSTLATSLTVSNALQVPAPATTPAQATFADFPNVHYETEADLAVLVPPWARSDDSYMATPWEDQSPALDPTTGPLNITAAFYDSAGTKINGGETVNFAYVTVPNGGEATIDAVVAHLGAPEETTTLSLILDSDGNLNAIPEPSSFIFLGVLAIGAIVRYRVKKSRTK